MCPRAHCRYCQCDFITIPLKLELPPQEDLSSTRDQLQASDCSGSATSHTNKRKRKKPRKYPSKCSYCNKVFDHKSSMDKHLRTHTGERPFSCQLCPMKFTQKHSAVRHMRTHTGERPFQCCFCPMAFNSKWDQKKHEGIHTRRAPQIVSLKEGFPDAIVSDNGPQFVSAEFQNFLKERGIKHFLSSLYYPQANGQQLPHGVKAPEREALGHTDGTIRLSQFEMSQEELRDFIALPLQLEPCPQQGLSEGRHLLQHPMNSDTPASHTTERRNKHPHKCSYCGKAFKQKSGLHKHLRVHTGERPFCCHLCPMTFTQREAVVRHVRTHTGERPFHCPFCLKSYRDSTNLRRHKATHAWQFTSNVSFSAGSS
nr:zinc finger protein 551-like [Dermacentor andersoni]